MAARGQVISLRRVRERATVRLAPDCEGNWSRQAAELVTELQKLLRQPPAWAPHGGGIGRPDELKPS